MFNLNHHTHRLFEAEPVFAAISRRTDKHVSRDIPTAGVRINPDTGYYEMLYNDEFFEKLSDEHRLGVLMHEFYHLMLFHVSSRLPDELEAVMNLMTLFLLRGRPPSITTNFSRKSERS